jgi:glycosyltransferase involved in cell wall biosynthesis
VGRRTGRLVIDWCDWWGRGGTQDERRQSWLKLIGPYETFFEEAFRTKADGTTVISTALRDRAIGLRVPPETIRLLPQGCDQVGEGADARRDARRRLRLADADKIVICVGALMPSDADLLFSVVLELFARRPDCRFFLIGKHGAHVPDPIKRHPQFTETGFVPAASLADFVVACDCLLTPLADTLASRARWPSKINPVLAAGRTAVVTLVGDLPHLLQRERAAAVARCDPEDLVRQTLRVLEDDALREGCEARAREVARDLLAWPILTAQLEGFYLGLPGGAS